MMLKPFLRRDNRGIGAVEFALVAPVLISFVIGISQMGKLFFANADMKNAMAHGARAASVWPVPQDPEILAAVNGRIARTGGVGSADVTLVRGMAPNGNEFVDINMDYEVPLDFIFFNAGPVTLRDSRRVFTQMNGVVPPPNSSTTGGTTSTTSTSTTSSGDPSSTSTTSSTTSGGTTSSTTSGGTTSSTSATSAGGTTSSTSATSASSTGGTTSSTTSSTTSASTTSSSGNGNSNGNSSHGHGDCKKKC